MSDQPRAEVVERFRQVIAWEMSAQLGMKRPMEHLPTLMADTLLDFFDVSLKPGADTSDLL